MNTCPCHPYKKFWWHGGGEAVNQCDRTLTVFLGENEHTTHYTAIQYRNIHTKTSIDSSIHYCRLTRGWSMGQATYLWTTFNSLG